MSDWIADMNRCTGLSMTDRLALEKKMADEPGKYDALCIQLRAATQAQGVALIVLEGNKGSGFSVNASMVEHQKMPQLLRQIADGIERELLKQQTITTRPQ